MARRGSNRLKNIRPAGRNIMLGRWTLFQMDIRTVVFFYTSVKISKLSISMLCNAEIMNWVKTDVDTFTLKAKNCGTGKTE